MSESDNRERRDDGADDPREETIVEILGFEDDPAEPAAEERIASEGGEEPGEVDVSGVDAGRLEFELALQKERYLRLRADFDNYRKRAERDRAEVERYALSEPARELLPVVDNLERALAAGGEGGDLRKGVEMILRQLEELLRRLGVEPVRAQGERFDPSIHEAVMREESDEVAAPLVVAELLKGYRLNGRLIRPAMVRVAVPREADESHVDSPETD